MKFFGFTLIELLVVVVLIAVATVLSTPLLLGTLRKNWLATETEKVIISLKMAQQNSRAAIDGKQYGVKFSLDGQSYQPIPNGALQKLQHGVKISSISEEKIEFRKLTGELLLDSGMKQASVVFSLGDMNQTIEINSQGVVEMSSQ